MDQQAIVFRQEFNGNALEVHERSLLERAGGRNAAPVSTHAGASEQVTQSSQLANASTPMPSRYIRFIAQTPEPEPDPGRSYDAASSRRAARVCALKPVVAGFAAAPPHNG